MLSGIREDLWVILLSRVLISVAMSPLRGISTHSVLDSTLYGTSLDPTQQVSHLKGELKSYKILVDLLQGQGYWFTMFVIYTKDVIFEVKKGLYEWLQTVFW